MTIGGSVLLITGADGFVGKHILEQANHFESVVAFVLPKNLLKLQVFCQESLSDERYKRLSFVAADTFNMGALDSHIQKVTHVLHCIGEMRGSRPADYFEANVSCLERVLVYIRESASKQLKRIVLLSSQAVVGPGVDLKYLSEEAECLPLSAYGESKLAGEKLALKFAKDLPITILRPCSIYGPHDMCFLRSFKLAQKGQFGYLFDREKYFNLIYISDLVRAIFLALGDEKSGDEGSGEIYFISDEKTHDWQEFRSILGDIFKCTLREVFLGKYLAYPYLYFFDIKEFLFGRKDILNSIKARELQGKYWLCTSQKFRSKFGFAPLTSLKDGMQLTKNWYQKNGLLGEKKATLIQDTGAL